MSTARRLVVLIGVMATMAASCQAGISRAAADSRPPASPVSKVTEVSLGCAGQNAEAEQAVDGAYVYITWIGCGGIGFARSADGGRTFGRPVIIPGSAGVGAFRTGIYAGIPKYGWDPSIAVGPDHVVYVAYMLYHQHHIHPVVAVSTDWGATFGRLSQLASPVADNWGDRDFIAVSPAGTLYLTWDFGTSIRTRLANVVMQSSTDGGRTWSPLTVVSPGYPDHGGGVAAPLLAERGGRIDVAFWDWSGGAKPPYALPPDHIYFTSSRDNGRTWSRPAAIRAGAGRIGFLVTWIDVNLGIDAAGNLYATWDTQSPGGDIGWLSFSADHGQTWSPASRVTQDRGNAEHIMAVAGGGRGIAYVGWLAGTPHGFAQYLRAFSTRAGWLSGPVQVSSQLGASSVWPGDTIGISVLPGSRPRPVLQVSWGSAVSGPNSEIFTAAVTSP